MEKNMENDVETSAYIGVIKGLHRGCTGVNF